MQSGIYDLRSVVQLICPPLVGAFIPEGNKKEKGSKDTMRDIVK
jgi:hypothetical protein